LKLLAPERRALITDSVADAVASFCTARSKANTTVARASKPNAAAARTPKTNATAVTTRRVKQAVSKR